MPISAIFSSSRPAFLSIDRPNGSTVEGNSTAELKEAFIEAVEDYLDICKRQGKEPQKAYKGSFNVRINPELHKRAVLTATADGISLNQLVEKAVENYVK